MDHTVHIKTKLLGHVIAVEKRIDAKGDPYLVDDAGVEWVRRYPPPIRAHDLEPKGGRQRD